MWLSLEFLIPLHPVCANYQQSNMQMSWHTMYKLCYAFYHGSHSIHSKSSTLKLLRLRLVLLWCCCVGVCLNHQLLLLPSFPPSTSTLGPFNTLQLPDYRPLHYSCNLSFSDKPVFNPFQVDKTNCVPNCKLCSIWWGGELNAQVQLAIIVGLCVCVSV